jgi:hypothetical protein
MGTFQELLDEILQSGERNVINPVKNLMGMRKTVVTPAELPFGLSDANNKYRDTDPLFALPKSTIPSDLPTSINAFRADPSGKYGGAQGIETLPISRLSTGGDRSFKTDTDPKTSTVLSDAKKATQQLYRYARLNGAAANLGMPSLTPEEIAAFVLKEGRTDLGFNSLTGSPQEKKYEELLRKQYNITSDDANFLTAMYSKKNVADRLGIPFAMAWNGTGVNDAGQSGKDYAKNYVAHKKAALHEKNKGLLDLINRAVKDGQKYGLPLKANESVDSTDKITYEKYANGGNIPLPEGYRKGGRVRLV